MIPRALAVHEGEIRSKAEEMIDAAWAAVTNPALAARQAADEAGQAATAIRVGDALEGVLRLTRAGAFCLLALRSLGGR